MKFSVSLSIIALCAIAFLSSCDSSGDSVKDAAAKSIGADAPSVQTPSANPGAPPTAEPAQNAAGVWHYTCPNGCAGGGGAQGPCPSCGATLAHNAAYHGDANQQPTSVTPTPAPGGITAQPKAEPAQNTAGVWHYTYPNGCAGGGGAQGPCPSCGATLAHNSAYHQ